MADSVANLRGEILLKAHKTINQDRQNQYGDAEDNFALIADFWNTYLDGKYPDVVPTITAADVAMMMVFLKTARIATGVYAEDNYVDLAGYAALAEHLDRTEGERLRDAIKAHTDARAEAEFQRDMETWPEDSMEDLAREYRERKRSALLEYYGGFGGK